MHACAHTSTAEGLGKVLLGDDTDPTTLGTIKDKTDQFFFFFFFLFFFFSFLFVSCSESIVFDFKLHIFTFCRK